MLCQSCKEKEANVHITKIINGVKTELHLCEDCAKKQESSAYSPFYYASPMSFQNIVEGFVEMMGNPVSQYTQEKKCPVCGQTFEDFRRSGMVGCGNCYSTFKSNMLPLIKRVHGNIEHTGKLPKRTGGLLKIKRDIGRLREELKMAISNEEYENAAKIRDSIRELEAKLNEGPTGGD